MNDYTLNKVYRICRCDGACMVVEVGRDLIEIRDREYKDYLSTSLTIDKDLAKMLAVCLQEIVLEMEKKEHAL